MTKQHTDYELRLLREIASNFGIDRHTGFHVVRNFICSVGRVVLKDFRKIDAVDPDFVFFESDYLPIGGYDNGAVNESLKAYQRADYYIRRYEHIIRHVVDWLTVAGRENHSWLHNVDDKGRPKKLLKCGSLEDLAREADKQMRRHHQIAATHATKALTSEDIRFEVSISDDLHLVRLLSPAALDDESARMSHCIGHGSYDHRLEDPATGYYSIRTADDEAMATVEVDRNMVRQFYGYSNTKPSANISHAFEALMDRLGWRHWKDVYAADVQRRMDYTHLHRILGWPHDIVEYNRYVRLPEDDQLAEIALLRAAVGLAPGEPLPIPEYDPPPVVDGQREVRYVEIVCDGDEFVERAIDDADYGAAPRPR